MHRKNGQGSGEHLIVTQSETEIVVPPTVDESKGSANDDAKKRCEYELIH